MADAIAIFTPGQRLVDETGTPYAGATVEFYDSGTSTPRSVYADSNLTVLLGTVVYTDSAGYPVTASGGSTKTQVFTGVGVYDIVGKNTAGVSVFSHARCVGAVVSNTATGSTGITQAQGDVRYIRNANALSALAAIADADLMPFWSITGAANTAITYANFKIDLTADFRADGRMMPIGTRQPFQQTTPPTGWTKETAAAYNDAVCRFSTSGSATGGTASFATTFALRTPNGTIGATTLSIANLAFHAHQYNEPTGVGAAHPTGTGRVLDPTSVTAGSATSSQGSATSFTPSFTGGAMDFAVKYVELSIGVKA